MSAIVDAGFELTGEKTKLRSLLADVWRSRVLIQMLSRKDFLVRYRRASFGLLWAIGLPLVQASIMAVVLTRFIRFQTPVHIAVFSLAGMLPWTFFSTSVGIGTTSIVEGSDLATRVYFPRAVLPIVASWASLRGYVPSLGVLIVFAAAFKAPLDEHLLLLIPATVLMLSLTISFSLVFAALQVYFRDVRFIVQASILAWFWASGVVYPMTVLKGLRRWFELNPVVGMIELSRAALHTASPAWGRSVLISGCWVVALLALSLPLYRRYDRVFVDLL